MWIHIGCGRVVGWLGGLVGWLVGRFFRGGGLVD